MEISICKANSVNMPDNCDDCTVSCEEFAEFQNEVNDALDNKQDKLTAGEHITITTDDEGNTVIDATGAFTKEELLNTLGYQEVEMQMTDTDGEQGRWLMLAKPLNPVTTTIFDGAPSAENDPTEIVEAEVGDLITVTLIINEDEYVGTGTKTADRRNVYVTVEGYPHEVTIHAEDGQYELISIGDVEPLPDNMTVTVTKYQ